MKQVSSVKRILLLLICAMLLLPLATALASTDDTEFTIGQKTYLVNGTRQSMDVAPFIKNGRVLVPIRYLSLAVGVAPTDIRWDPVKNQVTLKKGQTTVVLTIGRSELLLNGQAVAMDTAPLIENQRTFLPARYVAESFGYAVRWEAQRQTVKITTETEDNEDSFEVEIEDFAFSPGTVTIHQGDSVTWRNRDSAAHTATGDGFDSGRLDLGESFTFTFQETGTFDYICTYHPTMRGKIIVEP